VAVRDRENCILLENYFLPGNFEDEIDAFVDHITHQT